MDEFEKFYNRILRFLSYRPRSEKEVTDYLKKKRADPPLVSQVLNKLKEQNLVNDEEFARFWVEQRTTFRPRGIRVIRLELRQKGIDEEIIEKILSNEDIKILGKDAMRRLVEKRIERYRSLPKDEVYQKLTQFLLRRGFEFETIKRVLDEVLGKRYNEVL